MRKNSILVITSSPRPRSNSALAAYFLANKINARFDAVNINSLKINPCIACGKCAKTFKCFMNDGAEMVAKKIKNASVIIAASPVYFTGVPGKFKIFIDRNQPQWYKRSLKSKVKNPKLKAGVIILTQGDKKSKYFRPAESEIRSFFAVNGILTKSVIKLTEMDEPGTALNNKKALGRLNAAVLNLIMHG